MQVPLKTALLDEIHRMWKKTRRWIPKKELETFSKKIGYLGDNGTRRLRELAEEDKVDKVEIDGHVHYRKKVERLIRDED